MSVYHNSLRCKAFIAFARKCLCSFLLPVRRQRHHPGDRAAEGPRLGPAQAHADLLHGRAAVPARARVPAVPVCRGPRAHRAREAAEFVRNTGKRKSV